MKYEVLDFSGSPLKYEIVGNKISVSYEDNFKGYGTHTANMTVRVTEPGSIGTILTTSVDMEKPSPPSAYYITFKTGTNPNAVFSGTGYVGTGNDTNGRIIAVERSFSNFSAINEPRLVSINWQDTTGTGHFNHVITLHISPGVDVPYVNTAHITRVSDLDYLSTTVFTTKRATNYSILTMYETRKEKLLPGQVYQIALSGGYTSRLARYVLPYE